MIFHILPIILNIYDWNMIFILHIIRYLIRNNTIIPVRHHKSSFMTTHVYTRTL